MPKKKKIMKKTRTASKANKKWNPVKGVNNKVKLIFAGLFALIAVLLLYRVFALSTSVTYKGEISPENPVMSYQFSTGEGTMRATLKPNNNRNTKMRVSIKDLNGKTLASEAIGSARNKTQTIEAQVVAGGKYVVSISWDGDIESAKGFSLTVNYPINEPEPVAESTKIETYKDEISPSKPKMNHQITAGAGALEATLKPDNSVNTKMRVTISDSTGKVLVSDTIGSASDSTRTVTATAVSGQTYTVAVDWDGNIQSAKGYTLSVSYQTGGSAEAPADTTAPATVITAPTSGTAAGNIEITASATDASGIEKVEFYIDSRLLSTDTSSSYRAEWDTKDSANGTHNITVKAHDKAGNVGQASLTVNVDNQTDTPTPTISGSGIWVSSGELMGQPSSGQGWEDMKSAATGSLGSVNLSDNDNRHDTSVLALAYYSVRRGDQYGINRVAQEIATVPSSSRSRALEFCRNITSYVIAADVIGLASVNATTDSQFKSFIKKWVIDDSTLQGHSGSGIKGTAANAPNNWGGMCRAAYAATARYLGDNTALDNVTKWHKGFLGDNSAYSGMKYTATNWHSGSAGKKGINAVGATISGRNVDGVIPEDQRRTGEFEWPAPKGTYPWEAMQGALVTDVILQRAGKISATHEDSAMVRAYNWLYNVNNNPAIGDDRWQPWVVNKYYGTNFPRERAVTPGKLMGWTDWTHQ